MLPEADRGGNPGFGGDGLGGGGSGVEVGVTMHARVGPGAVLRVGGRIVGVATWFLRAEGGPVERYPEGDPEEAREAAADARHARRVAAGRAGEEEKRRRTASTPSNLKVKIEKQTPPKRARTVMREPVCGVVEGGLATPSLFRSLRLVRVGGVPYGEAAHPIYITDEDTDEEAQIVE